VANASAGIVENVWGPVTIVSQPMGLTVSPGTSVTFRVRAIGTGPLSYQWRREGAPLPGAIATWLTLTNVQPPQAGRYDVVVAGGVGCTTSSVAWLNLVGPGIVDYAYNLGANNSVLALALQPDGKMVAGGSFTMLAGQARSRIGRLNPDGTLDAAFDPVANGTVNALAVQPDGKILVGGSFTSMGGQARSCLARVNADGALDSMFNPGATGGTYLDVDGLAVQPDGSILVMGGFTTLGGQPRNNIGRLTADGALDTGFDLRPLPSGSGAVYSFACQTDGKLLVSGWFTSLCGQERAGLARVHPNATLDAGFSPGTNHGIAAIAVQPDDRILVGGYFTNLAGRTRYSFGRFYSNGLLEAGFSPEGRSDEGAALVCSLVLQTDGKLVAGGAFSNLCGTSLDTVGRLRSDGSFDPTLYGNGDDTALALAIQSDGAVVVGGDFSSLGGQPRSRLARILNTETATQTLACTGTAVIWMRGGTSPEAWRTTFERGSTGGGWSMLGAGARTSGGWRLDGLALTGGLVRARAYTVSGYHNGSMGIVETQCSVPYSVMPLVDITNASRTVACDTAWLPVAGTNNAGVVGTMRWTNSFSGASGAFPAAPSWTVAAVPLRVGTNVVTVSGTNAVGIPSNDNVVYTRKRAVSTLMIALASSSIRHR
jgi:uncharacterized delta-60 repeat protein